MARSLVQAPTYAREGVSVVTPYLCPFDQRLHISDAMRCIEIVANEPGVQLVVTLACGCPLIAVRMPS